jgi:hypothetical protein
VARFDERFGQPENETQIAIDNQDVFHWRPFLSVVWEF